MLWKQILKEIYYLKIKKMSKREMLLNHLKKIGMNIGENCWIYSEKIETSEPYLITLGNNVMIASDVIFTTHDASASYYIPNASDIFGRINIGNSCFIGAGAIILPCVSIADNCIIGAGSVVTRSFNNPGMMIAGNPAKELCTVEYAKTKNEKYALNVWNVKDKKNYLLENEAKFKGYMKTND